MATLANRLARALADHNDTLFGVPGGGPNLEVIGAATDLGMRFVLAHSETAAAIMASSFGLLTNSPAGLVATRGPGAAAAVNGIAQATLDRYPLVAITDTVESDKVDRFSHQRLNQRAMLAPVTAASATLSDRTTDEDLAALIDRAGQWPSGAVHLDYDPSGHPSPPPAPPPKAEGGDLSAAIELIAASSRPLVIVGMEAAVAEHRHSASPIRDVLTSLGCPVLTTYQAVGVVDTESPLCAGLFTNALLESSILEQADVVITVGLDTVEPLPVAWARSVPVVRLSNAATIDSYMPATATVTGPVYNTLATLVARLGVRGWKHEWVTGEGAGFRRRAQKRLTEAASSVKEPGFGPLEVVQTSIEQVEAAGAATDDLTVTVDAGAHFLAVMPFWPVSRTFGLLISNGLATMGFAIPAAVGAALARPRRPVLAFVGDGGASMTLGELETISRLNLPITIVVFNDAGLSLIEAKQKIGQGGSSAVRYASTDYATIASASGVRGYRVDSADQLAARLAEGWDKPRLIDARIDRSSYRSMLAVSRG